MSGQLPKMFLPGRVEEPRDLKHMWEINRKTYGDQPFFTYKKEKDAVRDISYNEMCDIIQKLGAAFFKIGVMGENTALLSETRYEWLASYLTVVNGNGIIVPLDKELAEDQILNFIERAKVTCVVYSGAFAKLIEDYAKSSDRPEKTARIFINLDLEPQKEDLPEYKDFNICSFDNLLKTGETALNDNCTDYMDVKIDREKPCAYLFTS
ncbi:MAG: long-chain fatty acid--CoA ligase, partial [Oscillospiraceae bacterium]|nr:long-chain fatty acid--CoA ligase [Oscillospiraceae bacterium]